MGAQFLGRAGGILTIKVTGRLEQPELARVQRQAAEAIREQGPGRILVLTEDFQGWARGGDWDDLSFQMEHDAHIEKMAVVADEPWKDLALLFTGRGLRPFPVEHFLPGDEDKARAWLAGKD
jgi:SpoIIAA-like